MSQATSMQVEQVDTIYGAFIGWKDDLITNQLKAFSAHTRNELAMVRSFLAPGDCVVDIGAHIGTYAIPFARFTAPDGHIYAFEANPANFQLLARNVEANGLAGRITTTHAVVSDQNASFDMHLQEGANSGMYFFMPRAEGGGTLPRVHLDAWLESRKQAARVALLKIDVEGAELSVLRACLRTIKRDLPVLYVEISTPGLARFNASAQSIEALLAAMGYHFFRNVGERNSTHDRFEMARLFTLADGGPFFDLLAVHPSSPAYRLTAAAGNVSPRR